MTPALPQASDILAALGQAVFAWDIASDVIVWGEQLSAVFPGIPAERLATGAEFAKLIEPAPSLRTAALAQTSAVHGADGTPYRVEYGVRMSASDPVVWVEETGRWFAGPDGRPVRALGSVRINNERHARDEELTRLARLDPLTGELNR